MTALANDLGVGTFGLLCAQSASSMWQGGNQWSAWDSYLSFFQDIAKLPIDYSHYSDWRALAEHSGPRIMHPDFCMISDRPELLRVDDQNRPHGEDGPFCRWRDGSALYAWHGQYIPARWIEVAPPTAKEALTWRDTDQRSAAMQIAGWHNILAELGAKVVDRDESPMIGTLFEADIPDAGASRFLHVMCGTGREFALPVPPKTKTAIAAQAWLNWSTEEEIRAISVRT